MNRLKIKGTIPKILNMVNFKIATDEITEIKRILNPFRGWMRKFEYSK